MMVGDVVNVVSGPCAGMVGVVLEAKSQVIYVNLRKNAFGSAVPFGPFLQLMRETGMNGGEFFATWLLKPF